MAVDSDDLVSRRLASWVRENADADGWYMPDGYLHIENYRNVIVVDDFYLRCGSSLIVSLKAYGMLDEVDEHMRRGEIVDALGANIVKDLFGGHRSVRTLLAARGVELSPLPFAGAIWEVGTGENYIQTLNSVGKRLPVTTEMAAEFGLQRSNQLRHGSAVAKNLLARVRERTRR